MLNNPKKHVESFSIAEGIEWMRAHPMRTLTISNEYLEYRWNPENKELQFQSSMSGKWFKSESILSGRFLKDWYADIGFYS